MLFKNYDQLIANGSTPELKQKRKDILTILTAALHAVDPYQAVHNSLTNQQITIKQQPINPKTYENIFLIGFGKASIKMAAAIQHHFQIKKGIVISNYLPPNQKNTQIQYFQGGHPLPNENSIIGAQQILTLLQSTTTKDLVIFLISGGGSALLCHPRVPLKKIQHTTKKLLDSGADITEINTIRKHLSHVKGGQLLTYTKATCVSLIISDVVGDPIEFIASGPTAPDSTTFEDAYQILQKYQLWEKTSKDEQDVITQGLAGKIPDTPKPENPLFNQITNHIIANNNTACIAAEKQAKKLGYTTVLDQTPLTGEARIKGPALLPQIKHLPEHSIYITGGETTVTIQGDGVGGRNQELILSLTPYLAQTSIVAASFATDGIDGSQDSAGAIADSHTQSRAEKHNIQIQEFLNKNDSYTFFSQLQDCLITHATGTNVMDIQILLK